jgi:hypothetical protein
LGSEAVFLPDLTEKELTVIDPAGKSGQIYPMTETVLIKTPIPGLYELKTEKGQYRFTVNAISKTESDLTKATTGKWGKWQQAGLYWWEYRPLDWLLLLIALTTLTIHRLITANQQKGSSP